MFFRLVLGWLATLQRKMFQETMNAMQILARPCCSPTLHRIHLALLCGMLLSLSFFAFPLAAQDAPPASPGQQRTAFVPPGSDVLAYWYGPNYRTIFVTKPNSADAANIPRNSLEYTHAGFWTMGSNVGDLTLSKSNMAEPANGGGSGAVEVYFIWRSTLGLNEVTHSRSFHVGPLRDVSVELGTNLETKNSSYSPAEKTIYFGPTLQFAVPKGFFNVGLHLRKEWNHEAVLGKADDYAPDFNIEPTWMLPFAIGKVLMAYSGFAEYNTPKGKDSFGAAPVSEFLLRNYVSVDLGALLLHKPQLIELNGGFWYWNNEYGKSGSDPGAKQFTPIFGIALRLDKSRAHHN